MDNQYRYIAIEGNIGAGKSTLANLLAQKLTASLLLEEYEDNSFLPKFYAEPKRYAFPLEMSFLAARFNQLKNKLTEPELFNRYVVSDYVFAKCLLFSKVTLDDDEYELYQKLFNIINLQLPQPDLLIYLHSPIEKLQEQIKQRGRTYEQQIEDEYLLNLQNSYLEYLSGLKEQRIIMVHTKNLDFVKNTNDFDLILKSLQKDYSPGIHHLNHESF